MSHSYKHNNNGACAGHGRTGLRDWKKASRKLERSFIDSLVIKARDDYETLSIKFKYNEWDSPRDGKVFYGTTFPGRFQRRKGRYLKASRYAVK